MIRFAYPNVILENLDDSSNYKRHFLGCGRFAVFASGETAPPDYEEADPKLADVSEVMTAASLLAQESVNSKNKVWEIRDVPVDDAFKHSTIAGLSQDLAYLLALIKRSRILAWEKLGYSHDIWCTGSIEIHDGIYPIVKSVYQSNFDVKLEQFLLDPTDMLFLVPIGNTQPKNDDIIDRNGARLISLEDLKGMSDKNIFERKTIVKLFTNELEPLVQTLFMKPEGTDYNLKNLTECALDWFAKGCHYRGIESSLRKCAIDLNDTDELEIIEDTKILGFLMMCSLHLGENWAFWVKRNLNNNDAPHLLLKVLEIHREGILYERPRFRAMYALQNFSKDKVSELLEDNEDINPENERIMREYILKDRIIDFLISQQAKTPKAKRVLNEIALLWKDNIPGFSLY